MKRYLVFMALVAIGCKPNQNVTSDQLMHAVDQSDKSWMTLWSNDVVNADGDSVRCWYKVTIPEAETKSKQDATLDEEVVLKRMASSSEVVTPKAISTNQLSANLKQKGVDLEKAEQAEAAKNGLVVPKQENKLILGNVGEWRAMGNKAKKENPPAYESRVRWVQYVAANENLKKEQDRTTNGQVRAETEKDQVELKQLLALEAIVRQTGPSTQNHDCESADKVFSGPVPTTVIPMITELKRKKCDPNGSRFEYAKNSYVIVEEGDKCAKYLCTDKGWVVWQPNTSCNDW